MKNQIFAVTAACLLLTGCGTQAQPKNNYTQDELPYGATMTVNYETTIPIQFDSRFITNDMRDAVVKYYNAIQTKDVDSYIAVQLPQWHDYAINTVYSGQYTDLQLLKTVYDNSAKDFGGSFTYTMVSIESAKQCTAESQCQQVVDVLDELAKEQGKEKISKDITAKWEISVTRFLDKKGSEVRGETKNILKDDTLYLIEYQTQWYIIIT